MTDHPLPETADQEVEKAQKLHRNGQLTEALEKIEALLQQKPDPSVSWERIRILRDMGQGEVAHHSLKELLASDPTNPRWQNGLAILHAELGQLPEGVKILRTIVESPNLLKEWRVAAAANLATLYFEGGWLSDGLFHATTAIENNRDMRRAHFLIGLHAPGVRKVNPSEVFRIDSQIHLYPYVNFDLARKEDRWTLTVTAGHERWHFLRTTPPNADENYNLAPGRKVIAGIPMDDAFYGCFFKIASRLDEGLELLALTKPVLLTRIQRRGYIRAYDFDPTAQIEVDLANRWKKFQKGTYTVLDLSATGMRLSCPEELKFGQRLRITFQLDKITRQTEATAVRMEPNRTYGIQFLTPSEQDVEWLHKAVFQIHLRQLHRAIRP